MFHFLRSVLIAVLCVDNCFGEDYGCMFYKDIAYNTHVCENLAEERGVFTSQKFCDKNSTRNFDINSPFAQQLLHIEDGECVLPLTNDEISQSDPSTFILSGLNSTEVASDLFPENANIKSVIVQSGNIQTIRPNSFINLPDVTDVIINFNKLKAIEPDAFDNLPQLENLYLNNNQIISVEMGNYQFKKLDMSTNNISYVNKTCFNNLRNLTNLDLSLNKISGFERCPFCNLDNLGTLDLKLNIFYELPQDFDKGMTSLRSLNIHECRLKIIKEGTFSEQNSNLEILNFVENQIAAIESKAFQFLKNLRNLILGRNSIRTLPSDVFSKLESLEELYLDENFIEAFPNNLFRGLNNLNTLSLPGNRLTTLPGYIFQGLFNLTYLDLEHNKLIDLHKDLFKPIPKIDKVLISHNELTFLYAEFLNLFKKESHPSFFAFHDNPWQCSCLDDILKKFKDLGIGYDFYRGSRTSFQGSRSLNCVLVQGAEDFCIKDIIFTKDFPNIYLWARQRFEYTFNNLTSAYYNLRKAGQSHEDITEFANALTALAGVSSLDAFGFEN